jgi:PAS domain S-box-containing protein
MTGVTQIQAKRALNEANVALESNLKTRTDELEQLNAQLNKDISDRRRIEQALSESELLYRTLIITSPDAIVVCGLDGTLEMVNPAAVALYGGKTDSDLIGKNAFEFIADESMEPAREFFSTALETDIVRDEFTLLKVNNDRYMAEVSISIIRDEKKEPKKAIAILRDTTERKNAEEALEAEKERFAATLSSIGDGVIATDTEGNISLLNPVAENLTGVKNDEAIGKPLREVFYIVTMQSRQQCDNPVAGLLKGKQRRNLEYSAVLVSRDSTERVISYTASPIFDSSKNIVGAVLVFRDITKQKRMEDELFKARKLDSIGVLAGGIAHDFNNILTGIITNLFMAKMSVPPDSETGSLIIESEKAAFRASKLTKQLLTFSKGGAPVKENASIRELIEESVGFCLSGSNVDYTLELDDDLYQVEVDRGQIDQVINNLIINADHAMPEGGTIVVRASNTHIGSEQSLPLREGRYVQISIIDSGKGIPRKNLERIFDPYFTTKKDGAGLGLTTAYSIIQKHGGHIEVESRPGKGATFTFYLPAYESEEADTDEKTETVVPGEGRILVMDDDEVVRVVVEKLLRSAGYDPVLVSSGRAAIRTYKNYFNKGERFDGVIMDLTVPGGMGGKEAVQKILEIDSAAKVIVFSGYSNDPIMANYKNFGFSGVIAKPFNIEEFTRVINRVISGEQ